MKNLVDIVTANGRKGRLDISGFGLDNRGIEANYGDYVEYYVKTVNPRSGASSFQVAHVVKILSREEFMKTCEILHVFEGVLVKPYLKNGESVFFADGGEDRWHGAKATVFDNRNQKEDIAIVTIRDNGFFQIESAPDQSQEPDFVFDIVSYRTNTKNKMYYYRFDEMEYCFMSRGGHANISYYTCLVVAKYGTKIAEPENMRGKVLEKYDRPVVKSNEEEMRTALVAKGFPLIREHGDNSLIGFKNDFRSYILIQMSEDDVLVHADYGIDKYFAYRHVYRRRSQLREIFDNITVKQVEPVLENPYHDKYIADFRYYDENHDNVCRSTEFLLEHQNVLEKLGYTLVREESTRYDKYVNLGFSIEKDGNSIWTHAIDMCLCGFPPIIDSKTRFLIPLYDELFPEVRDREQKFFVNPTMEGLNYNDLMKVYALWLQGWSVYTLEVEEYEPQVYVFDPVIHIEDLPKRISKEEQLSTFDNIMAQVPEECFRRFYVG